MSAERTGQPRRRRVRVAIVLIALLLGAAAAWWFWWVPNWRPELRPGERYGIDVSAHQGKIDWRDVAGDDITFAYIKATEGGDFVDKRFRENWREAAAAGLDRGVYHFFTLCTPGSEQARTFLSVAPPDRSAMAPAVDLELAGNCRDRPDPADVAGELDTFLRLVESAWDRKAVLYVGNDFEGVYPVRQRLDRALWHRRFLLRPNVEGWLIWQLHGYAKVDGVSGGVDLNVMRPGSPAVAS